MAEKYTRSRFLILPSYQIKLMGFLTALLFAGSVLHGFLLYLMTSRSIQEGFLSSHNRLRSTWEILKPAIVLANGVSFLVLALLLMAFSILISHRLIGPIFKIANRLRDLTEGRLHSPPLKLRRGDEGKIMCEAVNQLQVAWIERMSGLQRLREQLLSGKAASPEEICGVLEKALQDVKLPEDLGKGSQGH
jgi:methyl-accepting chemotaxis protein